MPPKENSFIPKLCEEKHRNIDININEIKENIEYIKREENKQHQEIKEMIINLAAEIKNLKNKIILNDQTMGDKIDELNKFDKTLKGNGDPGVWELVRANKESIGSTRKIGYWFMGVITSIMIVLFVITLGGEWNGLSKKTVKEETQLEKTTQVITTNPIVVPIPKTTLTSPAKIIPKKFTPKE